MVESRRVILIGGEVNQDLVSRAVSGNLTLVRHEALLPRGGYVSALNGGSRVKAILVKEGTYGTGVWCSIAKARNIPVYFFNNERDIVYRGDLER